MRPTLLRNMQRTLARASDDLTGMSQSVGKSPYRFRVNNYQSFKSQYGPDYKIGQHVGGINITKAYRLATLAGGMGAAAGIFALFFFDGVPKVQQDILQKIPLIGDFYKHEVAPEDNPF